MKKEQFFTGCGVFFVLLSVAGVVIHIGKGTPHNLIWLCNHTAFILGLAFLYRSAFWITAEISIGLIPQLLWSIDFLSKLLFDHFVFGFTDYMFVPTYDPALYILSLNHFVMVPIAFVGLYFLGVRKDAWKGALLHGAILVAFGYIFGNGNLNCVQTSCLFFIPTNIAYKVLGPPIFFFIVILPTNWLVWWMYKRPNTSTNER